MEVCFFSCNFILKDTHIRKYFFSRFNIFMNGSCAEWVTYAPKAYVNVFFLLGISFYSRDVLCYNKIIS